MLIETGQRVGVCVQTLTGAFEAVGGAFGVVLCDSCVESGTKKQNQNE